MNRSFRLLVAVVVALAAPLCAQRKVELDKLYKDKSWGYQIQPLKGWNSMPPDQEDRATVGRWKLALDEFEKRGDYEAMFSGRHCELQVVRMAIAVETNKGGAAPPAEPSVDDKLKKVLGVKNPAKSIDECCAGRSRAARCRAT